MKSATKYKKELEETKAVEMKRFETLQMSQSEDLHREREDMKHFQEEAQRIGKQVEKLTDEVFNLTNQNQ